jgi:acetylglutamate kinase
LKKTILALLVASTLLLATQTPTPKTQKEIKAEISRLQTQLNSLKTQMKSFEVVIAPKEELKTHTELGYIGTTGNTDTTTFNLDSDTDKDLLYSV